MDLRYKGTGGSEVTVSNHSGTFSMRFASIEINPISGDMAGNPLVWEGSSVASFPVPLFFKLEPADSGGYTGDTGDFKNFRIYGQPSHSYLKLYYRISDTFVAPGSMLYSGSYSLVPSTDPGASSPNIPLPGSAEYINLSSSSPQTQYFYLIVLMDAEPTETGLRSFTINFAWQQTV